MFLSCHQTHLIHFQVWRATGLKVTQGLLPPRQTSLTSTPTPRHRSISTTGLDRARTRETEPNVNQLSSF